MSRKILSTPAKIIGYVDAEILHDCAIGRIGEKIHAHEFHFSTAETSAEKIFHCTRLRTGKEYFAGAVMKNVVASYLHVHFAGCPNVAKNFVDACKLKRSRVCDSR